MTPWATWEPVYIPDTTTTPPSRIPPRDPRRLLPALPPGLDRLPRPPLRVPPESSGNAAQDIAKLVNSILQAFKPAQATNPQGQPVSQPAPAGGGFDFSSLILIGSVSPGSFCGRNNMATYQFPYPAGTVNRAAFTSHAKAPIC